MTKMKNIRPASIASPVYSVAVLIVVAAAVGLRSGVAALAEHYTKQTIAVRRPLADFPVFRLTAFKPMADISSDVIPLQEDLGTEEYARFVVQEKDAQGGAGAVQLFVTYYSDPRDRVPHTPEVCYRQSGAVVRSQKLVTLDTPELAPETPQIQVRQIVFQKKPLDMIVLYVFCANGEFLHDRQQVRWKSAMPGDKYIYFSKIEAIAAQMPNEDLSAPIERCKLLLRQALPVLAQEHFPEHEILKRS